MKKLNLFLLFLCTLGVGFLLNSQKSLAVTAADWKPGRIIDDVVFQNKSSMTVQQIQQFLDSKVPNCDRNGTLPMWSGGPSRAQWSADNGRDLAPYTCLKEYVENPTTKANNANDPTIVVPGGLSAAQLIFNASQAQNINPQVYLVLLQKEQSLVTDDWPYAKQFERATGNNCPDTAPCNPAYAWLSTQVNNAGAQFNYYVNNFNQYNYAPGWNNILYQANSPGCGTRNVFIENRFTAALYIYTPYTPNQAALDNMYGTGDACSAYGNRNFWRLFNDWFGSSLAPNYNATYQFQTFNPFILRGSTNEAIVQYRNTGNLTWNEGQVNLATTNPINRASVFGNTWVGTNNRPGVTFTAVYESDGVTLAADQQKVLPSQIARFLFYINVPTGTTPGSYTEYFQPVLEGAGNWNIGGVVWFTMNVLPTSFESEFLGQSSYPTIPQGTQQNAYFKFRNKGTGTWRNDNIRGISMPLLARSPFSSISPLSARWPTGSVTGTFTKVYQADGVTLTPNQNIVSPNQIAEFGFILASPIDLPGGSYRESFRLFMNNNDPYLFGPNVWLDVTIPGATSKLTYKSQSAYPALSAGQSSPAYFEYTNTGTTTLFDGDIATGLPGQVNLATTNPINRSSIFGSTWFANKNRPNVTFTTVYMSDGVTLSSDQDRILPGQIVRFNFNLTVPASTPAGAYREFFQPVLEGAGSWNIGGVVWLDITII